MNVITRYRKDAGLTEQELADASGVTRNYIVKLEQTVYAAPSDKVLDTLADLTYSSPIDILSEYTQDFKSKRDHMETLEVPDWSIIKDHLSVLLRTKPEAHPFVLLRQLLADWYRIPGSQIKWATTFNIHPAELSKYELGKTPNMPRSVVKSLSSIGMPVEFVGYIDSVVKRWLQDD